MTCESSPELPEAPETFGVSSKPLYATKVLATVDPEQVSEASIPFQKATFFAYKSFTNNLPIPNAGHIMFGFRNTNFPYVLLPGGSIDIEAPRGQKFDLAQMYVMGTVADGVVVQYS